MVYNTDKWHVVGGTEVSLQWQRKPLFFGKDPCNVPQLVGGQKQLNWVSDKTLHFKVLGEDRVKSLFSSKSMVSWCISLGFSFFFFTSLLKGKLEEEWKMLQRPARSSYLELFFFSSRDVDRRESTLYFLRRFLLPSAHLSTYFGQRFLISDNNLLGGF